MEAFDRLVRGRHHRASATGDREVVRRPDEPTLVSAGSACRVLGKVGGARARDILVILLENPEAKRHAHPGRRRQRPGGCGRPVDGGAAAGGRLLEDDPAVIVRSACGRSSGQAGQGGLRGARPSSRGPGFLTSQLPPRPAACGSVKPLRRRPWSHRSLFGRRPRPCSSAMDDADEQVASTAARSPPSSASRASPTAQGRSTSPSRSVRPGVAGAQSQVKVAPGD